MSIELVRLAAQFIGHPWKGCVTFVETTETRTPLRCTALDQGAEVAIAGKQHEMVDVVGHLHRVHGKLDVHIALELAPAERIHKLLCRLGHHGEAIILQPILTSGRIEEYS